MTHLSSSQPDTFLDTLHQIAPYLNAHRGKTFVVHLDATLWESEDFRKLCQDIALLQTWNVHVVLIPGNDLAITPLAPEQLRATLQADYQRFERLQSVLSSGALDRPGNAQRLRLAHGNVIRAIARGVIGGIDFLYLGEPRSLDAEQVRHWHESQSISIVLPKGYSIAGEVYALPSEPLAAWVAQSLSAEKLLYLCSDAKLSTLIKAEAYHWMTFAALREGSSATFLSDSARSDALRQALLNYPSEALKRIHLVAGHPGALIRELYTPRGVGFMIAADSYDLLRPAQMRDVPGILALIEPLEAQGVLITRPHTQIEREIEHFTVLIRDDCVIGCAALYRYDHQAELACFVVDQAYRGRGMAQNLLQSMTDQAIDQGIEALFVLTTQSSDWFIEQGFTASTVEALPAAKQAQYNHARQSKVYRKALPTLSSRPGIG